MENIMFRHSPVARNEKGETVKSVRYTFAGKVEGNKLRIGMARCSMKDNFMKLKGRTIAEGRVEKLPLISFTLPSYESTDEASKVSIGKYFYQVTSELIERLDNGYIKTLE